MWPWAVKLERRLLSEERGNEEGETDTTYEMKAERSLRKWGRLKEERGKEMYRKTNKQILQK